MKKIEYDTLSLIQKKLSKGRKTKIALSIAISSDNTKAYVACGNKGVEIFDITDISEPKKACSFKTYGYAFNVALSNDGTKVYVADGANGIFVKDVSDLHNLQNVVVGGKVGYTVNLKLSSDGTKAYAIKYERGLVIYKLIANGMFVELKEMASYSMPYCNQNSFTICNDDKTIFVSKENGDIDNIALDEDKIIIKESLSLQYKINRIILSDDEKIAYAIAAKNVIVFSVENNSLKKVINKHFLNRFVEDIIISGSGAYAKIGKDLIELVSIVKF